MLAAEPWVDGHHQYLVDQRQNFLEYGWRGRWIDHHSDFASVLTHQIEASVQMTRGFLVH